MKISRKHQIEILGLEQRETFAAIAGDDNGVPCPFQQQPDRRLNRRFIVHDQNFCHSPSSQTQ